MHLALMAGIGVEEFYRLTIGEVQIAIDAYHERERQTLISRISAVLRGVGPIFAKKGKRVDPYSGLGVSTHQATTHGLIRRGAKAWLFREDDE